jgi:hypothetical protein
VIGIDRKVTIKTFFPYRSVKLAISFDQDMCDLVFAKKDRRGSPAQPILPPANMHQFVPPATKPWKDMLYSSYIYREWQYNGL